jgi:alkanesulfonate monooxygenase SsuD/methylene tetrahydromethanopterin reductase-like flavin-dependent oxidoreductase (luciferase family)
MAESRDRFDEAAPMILEALETGFIEGKGPYYPQPRAAIRPRPTRSFKDRITCVGMSPDSAEAAARIGARLVQFSQKNWKEVKGSIDGYNALFRQLHNREPDLPMLSDFTFLDTDAGRAEERARKHLTSYFLSVMDNYEMGSEHFKDTKGYASYAKGAEVIRHMGLERVAEAYIEVNAWGTPQQVLDKLEQRRAIVGDFHMTTCFRYGGIPYEEAENSLRLFATQVMPELRRWTPRSRPAAAAD